MGPANIQPFTVDLYEAAKTGLEAYDIKNIDQLLPKLNMMPMQPQPMMPQPQELDQLQSVDYGGQ
jgi:hypothetical protein